MWNSYIKNIILFLNIGIFSHVAIIFIYLLHVVRTPHLTKLLFEFTLQFNFC